MARPTMKYVADEALRLESMLHDLARRVVESDDPRTMAQDILAKNGGASTRMVAEGACITTSGWVPRLIGEQFFRTFDEGGAVNNIEWAISHKGRHATITAQVRGGKTPSEQRDEVCADVARLERELAEARAEAARSAAAAVDAARELGHVVAAVTAERDALRAIVEGRGPVCSWCGEVPGVRCADAACPPWGFDAEGKPVADKSTPVVCHCCGDRLDPMRVGDHACDPARRKNCSCPLCCPAKYGIGGAR